MTVRNAILPYFGRIMATIDRLLQLVYAEKARLKQLELAAAPGTPSSTKPTDWNELHCQLFGSPFLFFFFPFSYNLLFIPLNWKFSQILLTHYSEKIR